MVLLKNKKNFYSFNIIKNLLICINILLKTITLLKYCVKTDNFNTI